MSRARIAAYLAVIAIQVAIVVFAVALAHRGTVALVGALVVIAMMAWAIPRALFDLWKAR